MPAKDRFKTKYPGVYYIESSTGRNGKSERVYYIVYRKEGKLIEEKLLVSLKDKYTLSSNIISFFYKNSREDILENLEIFTINAITQEDEVQSILLAGTTIDEKDVKKKRKAFSGYQIIGHLIPESLKENKHIEDFDIRFINDLLRAPQRFKKIEILIPDSEINITYKPLFQ